MFGRTIYERNRISTCAIAFSTTSTGIERITSAVTRGYRRENGSIGSTSCSTWHKRSISSPSATCSSARTLGSSTISIRSNQFSTNNGSTLCRELIDCSCTFASSFCNCSSSNGSFPHVEISARINSVSTSFRRFHFSSISRSSTPVGRRFTK